MDLRMEYEDMTAQRNALIQQPQAAEVHLLAVRETLAATIDERNDALAEVERLRVALKLIDEARANAVAEIEEVHRYLDECFVNDRDEGPVVPLIDRVVVLVSQIARDNAEVARRRTQVATMEAELAMTSNALRVTQDSVLRNIDRADVAEAEVERLRKALNLIDAARAEAVAKIAALNGTNAPSAHVHR